MEHRPMSWSLVDCSLAEQELHQAGFLLFTSGMQTHRYVQISKVVYS